MSTRPRPKKNQITIDLDDLTPEQRKKVSDAVAPVRDRQLSLVFPSASVEAWKGAAHEDGLSLTAWIERELGAALARRGK